MKSPQKSAGWLAQGLHAAAVGVLVLLPFHAVISTWAGTSLGYYLWFKSWKELLIGAMIFGSLYLLASDRGLGSVIFRRKINMLIIAYGLLHILTAIVFEAPPQAALVGILMNLRFLVFFGLVQIAAYYMPSHWNEHRLVRYIGWPAVIVVGFGFLQLTVLPDDFLRHFGYGPDTIQPFMTIDQKSDLIRVNSTLRGPNPLGAYLILPISMLVYWLVKRRNWLIAAGLTATGLILLASHSRSAMLGASVAGAVICLLQLPRKQLGRLVFIVVPLAVLGLVGAFLLRDTYLIQNTLFHTDENSPSSVSSNALHWQASSQAVIDIINNPLGQGPGTAGPASFYTDSSLKLAENYYLQIGQEVGVIGMVIFLAINVLIVAQLLRRSRQFWPAVLLASFAGIVIVNLFLHGWADDTLGVVWWGAAGATCSGAAAASVNNMKKAAAKPRPA